MRNIVILAGGFGLDTRNASAVRALGLAQMIQSLGYQVIVMGKFKDAPDAARSRAGVLIDDVTCRDISKPYRQRRPAYAGG